MSHSSKLFWLLISGFLVWGALFYTSIASAVAIWARSETFNHCFIILPICIYLLRTNWPRLQGAVIQPNYWVLVLIFGNLVLWLLGRLAQVLVVEQAAAFLILPLLYWTMLGNQAFRVLLFPACFWLFSVPFGDFLVPQLQELTADITVYALQLTQIPVYREGLYIAIPGGLFEVAVACSGIRYLIASFSLGTLYAYLNYQSSHKRLLFVLFSLALPLLANGIRAYGIVMIAHLSEMQYATGVDHLIYGWVFFGVVIFIMFAVGNIWAEPAPKVGLKGASQSVDIKKTLLTMAAVGLLTLLTSAYHQYASQIEAQHYPQLSALVNAEQVKSTRQSWTPILQNPTSEWSGPWRGWDLYLAYYAQNQQGAELVNSSHQVYDQERWSLVKQQGGGAIRVLEITNTQGDKRLLAYTYVTPWGYSASAIKTKLIQALQALVSQAQQGFFVSISVPLQEGITPQALTVQVQQLTEQRLLTSGFVQ